MLKGIKGSAFGKGIVLGVMICIMLDIMGIVILLHKGITIQIDTREVAMTVRNQVELHLRQKFPHIVQNTKKEIPFIVKKELKGIAGSAKVEIGDMKLTLPETFSDHLEKELQYFVIKTLNGMVDSMNTNTLVQEISAESYKMVKETLTRELHGKTFMIVPAKWVRIPVTVVTKN